MGQPTKVVGRRTASFHYRQTHKLHARRLVKLFLNQCCLAHLQSTCKNENSWYPRWRVSLWLPPVTSGQPGRFTESLWLRKWSRAKMSSLSRTNLVEKSLTICICPILGHVRCGLISKGWSFCLCTHAGVSLRLSWSRETENRHFYERYERKAAILHSADCISNICEGSKCSCTELMGSESVCVFPKCIKSLAMPFFLGKIMGSVKGQILCTFTFTWTRLWTAEGQSWVLLET